MAIGYPARRALPRYASAGGASQPRNRAAAAAAQAANPLLARGKSVVLVSAVVKTHEIIDRRSLALAEAIVATIDADPLRQGLTLARETCARWYRDNPSPAIAEWLAALQQDWEKIRAVLLDVGPDGQRLRQSNPFCGVLTPVERWAIYQRFADEQRAA
jgi:hypothetical protein